MWTSTRASSFKGITRKNVIDASWKHPRQHASQRRVNDRLAITIHDLEDRSGF